MTPEKRERLRGYSEYGTHPTDIWDAFQYCLAESELLEEENKKARELLYQVANDNSMPGGNTPYLHPWLEFQKVIRAFLNKDKQ